MRTLCAFCMMVVATSVLAAPIPRSHELATVTGQVLEVRDVENYTYLRLRSRDGETWAAVGRRPVEKGAYVTVENAIVLNKTFRPMLFGTLRDPAVGTARAMHVNMTVTGDGRVSRASGTNAMTVAEIFTKSAELKDQTVMVRGKVVKYNPDILGRNWVHLRDGTGSTVDETNDLVVTTEDEAKIGDVVTARGIVHTDMDFGSGYTYKVLIEEATLQLQPAPQ